VDAHKAASDSAEIEAITRRLRAETVRALDEMEAARRRDLWLPWACLVTGGLIAALILLTQR